MFGGCWEGEHEAWKAQSEGSPTGAGKVWGSGEGVSQGRGPVPLLSEYVQHRRMLQKSGPHGAPHFCRAASLPPSSPSVPPLPSVRAAGQRSRRSGLPVGSALNLASRCAGGTITGSDRKRGSTQVGGRAAQGLAAPSQERGATFALATCQPLMVRGALNWG